MESLYFNSARSGLLNPTTSKLTSVDDTIQFDYFVPCCNRNLVLVCINRNFSVLSHKRIKHQKIISLAPNGISTNEKNVNFHIMYICYQSQSRKLIQLFTLFSKEDGNKIKVHWRSEKRINPHRNKWLF